MAVLSTWIGPRQVTGALDWADCDLIKAPDHQVFVLALEHAGQQLIKEEDLRQGDIDPQDVVAKLVGTFAVAGKAVEIIEEDPVAATAQGCQDLVLVDAVDASVQGQVRLLGMGEA